MTQVDLKDAIADTLEDIRELLLPRDLGRYRLTLMARVEGNPEADIVVTNDDTKALVEMISRFQQREDV